MANNAVVDVSAERRASLKDKKNAMDSMVTGPDHKSSSSEAKK